MKRNIVRIDETKCDGCGLCVPSCAEGAIQVIDGKARLVADTYCDGLGACLGHCPRGAITIIQREAEPFDEEAARRHVEAHSAAREGASQPRGCPGVAARDLRLSVLPPAGPAISTAGEKGSVGPAVSALRNWPVQLHLVPPGAPFLQDCDLLLAADCVPFAYADFHRRLLKGRPVLVGCPKLDDGRAYVEKLAAILAQASIRSLTVVHMEVPCCTGLVGIARAALAAAGSKVPLEDVTISIRGEALGPSV